MGFFHFEYRRKLAFLRCEERNKHCRKAMCFEVFAVVGPKEQ